MRAGMLLALSVAATIAFSGGAQAGGSLKDLPPPEIVYDWSGVYVGVHAGGTSFDQDTEFEKFHLKGLGKGTTHELEGWLAGGHVGVQRQIGHFVFGLEASLSAGDVNDTASGSYNFNFVQHTWLGSFEIFGSGDEHITVDMRHLLLLTGRVGFAWNQWMIYAKGGYAGAEIGTNTQLAGELGACLFVCGSEDYSISGKTSERHHGWTIGGGLEFMVRPNLILGVEYNYVDLGSKTHKGTAVGEFAGFDFNPEYAMKVDPDAMHTVFARLSIKLGDAPAASMK
ncbi:outer membrane protein [Leptospira interrogans]